ncbi:hypothetical protein ABZZ20_28970 [Streptomyces sp. NPDC006430]
MVTFVNKPTVQGDTDGFPAAEEQITAAPSAQPGARPEPAGSGV